MVHEAKQNVSRDGVEQAADAIMRLINSRPHSPRHDEIVTIIERFVTGPRRVRQATPVGLDEYGPDLTKLSP